MVLFHDPGQLKQGKMSAVPTGQEADWAPELIWRRDEPLTTVAKQNRLPGSSASSYYID
jgi:hypothetical protein